MITSNVIHRVFRIKCAGERGSAFAIDLDKYQFLVTAKHVVASVTANPQLKVFSKWKWLSMPVRLVGQAPEPIDIAVLAVDRRLTPTDLPLEGAMAGLLYGQDVYFLGFPYDDLSGYAFGESEYPLPFVKKAIVSSFDGGLMYLDGHNNPGLSGGPVVYLRPGDPAFRVAGVISGFRYELEPVFLGEAATELVYEYNTGIVVAHSIDFAIEIARAKPIGFDLSVASI
jgi:hypothetical protein